MTPTAISEWEDLGVARTGTLPADWYRSRELYELEQQQLFRHVWQTVGRTEQVANPGDFFTCRVANEEIVVVRGQDGKLRALSNICLHRAGPVAIGCGSRQGFQCPYHGWTYELDGRMRNARGMEGAEAFDPKQIRLPEFRVATWGPLVWVCLEDDVPPLNEWLAQITPRAAHYDLDSLQYLGGRRWEIPCNWKMYVDNYMEGYHIPFVHPALQQGLNPAVYTYELGKWSNEQYGNEPHPRGPGSRVASALGSMQVFRSLKQPLPGLDPDEKNGYYFFWLFPTNTFNFMPDGFMMMTIRPLDVELTQCSFSWWMPPAKDLTDRVLQAAVVNFGHTINTEDVEICTHAQKGMHSNVYLQGRYSPEQEKCLHHFHRLVTDHMAPHISMIDRGIRNAAHTNGVVAATNQHSA